MPLAGQKPERVLLGHLKRYSKILGNVVDFSFGFLIFFSQKRCNIFEESKNSGTVQRKKCKTRKTLKNGALDAKAGIDTAANDPRKGSKIVKESD